MAARSVVQRVLATKAGPLQRLIGTTDFRGKGTTHPLAALDPIVLCDIGAMSGKGKPPFGMHPHYGLIAVTTVIEGCFMDADNLNGVSDHFNEALDIYAVSAGKGVCHEEKSAREGNHSAIQTIFKIPANKLDLPPELKKVTKDQIPVMKVEGGELRVNIGRLGDTESPATLKSLPRVVMARAFVEKGKTMNVPLDSDLEHGYVLVINGECKVGSEKESLSKGGGIIVFGSGGNLLLDNESGESLCDALVVAGKPLNEPWVKLLSRNGFIIAKDEETANRVEEIILKEENEFSYQKVQF